MSFSSPSSDFVLLATTDASSSASVSFDGYFSATYKNYKLFLNGVRPSSNGASLRIRFRRSNADITTSNYYMVSSRVYRNSGTADVSPNGTWQSSDIAIVNGVNSTDGNATVDITLFDPLSTDYKNVHFNALEIDSPVVTLYSTLSFGTLRDNTNALSGISFRFDTGNIAVGNFKLYGIK